MILTEFLAILYADHVRFPYRDSHSVFFVAIMMQCKTLSKTYLLLIILASVESLEITGNPQSVTNATVGGNATFECTLSSESASPSWNINGIDYQVTDLPFGHYFQSVSFSKRLIVNPMLKKMNNTSIFCNFNGRQESLPAKLIIIHELTTIYYYYCYYLVFRKEHKSLSLLE